MSRFIRWCRRLWISPTPVVFSRTRRRVLVGEYFNGDCLVYYLLMYPITGICFDVSGVLLVFLTFFLIVFSSCGYIFVAYNFADNFSILRIFVICLVCLTIFCKFRLCWLFLQSVFYIRCRWYHVCDLLVVIFISFSIFLVFYPLLL